DRPYQVPHVQRFARRADAAVRNAGSLGGGGIVGMVHVGPGALARMVPTGVGRDVYELAARLYPICRSITGEGVRQTLDILSDYIDLERHEMPSGTQVLDWVVPAEWTIRAASITGPDGRKI